MPLPLAVVAAQAAVSIGTSIAGVANANQRRVYEQNLALLNVDQKAKLENLLREANSEQARQQILAQTLGTANSARIDALAKVQVEKEKTKKTIIIASVVGVGLLLIVALIMRRK